MQSILLFTEVAHHSPVGFWYRKPFTVSWSDVDVDRTKVIVFLVTWRDTQNLFTAQIHTHRIKKKSQKESVCV